MRSRLGRAVCLVVGLFCLPCLWAPPLWADQSTFVRGDFSGDADLQLDDAIGLLSYLFTMGTPPACRDAGDVNDDGNEGLDDAIVLLTFLFIPGNPAPPPPYPGCGIDPTDDDPLDCAGPLTGCLPKDEGPDWQFSFTTGDDAELDPGIFISPNIDTVTAMNFEGLKFGMLPVTLDAPPSLTTGTVEVTSSLPILELYTTAGDLISLPASIPVGDLPLDLLLNATGTGNATLMALASDTGQLDIALLRSGNHPGLAGGILDSYPFFEFVRSINDDEIVQVALDPGRHAERVGVPFDIYVVEHKTPDEWAADNSLTDVTTLVEPGEISDISIVANTYNVWVSGVDGGDLVGEGYDIVCDFGQDGTLDPGDFIDGLELDEAGFYVVKNLNLPGPHDTANPLVYDGGFFLGQRTVYPADIANMGELPLVIISHGNGHQFTWYDYLQQHLASHGYVVMSHENNTGPGILSAATTTLSNTDYLLGNLDTIGGGVLEGHIDTDNIVWIGHSRGGEGVVVAYDCILEQGAGCNLFSPDNFTFEDVVGISSIAPTVFQGVTAADPHASNYHLLAGSSDGDVTGGADCSICQFFRIPQKGIGNVQVTYVQGADHNDFNCCGFNDGQGPFQIGRPAAQIVAKSYYLAFVELYCRGNPAAKDYFTRNYDAFRPSGIGANVVCATQYKDAVSTGNDVIDNYQTDTDIELSSSGGLVTFDVDNVFENRLNDINNAFSWTPTDPMNGMTQASIGTDLDFGVVFDWPAGEERFYELEVLPEFEDFSDDRFLSFRACQGTRHPNTVSLAGTLDFTVTLRDADGVSSSINFGELGTITRPYLRTGLGGGSGWANEYNTVRIRLVDFENDYSGIDLTRIVAIRFEFGGIFGSDRGRIGIDDVMVTKD